MSDMNASVAPQKRPTSITVMGILGIVFPVLLLILLNTTRAKTHFERLRERTMG